MSVVYGCMRVRRRGVGPRSHFVRSLKFASFSFVDVLKRVRSRVSIRVRRSGTTNVQAIKRTMTCLRSLG